MKLEPLSAAPNFLIPKDKNNELKIFTAVREMNSAGMDSGRPENLLTMTR
jgi:hypothetical protein